MHACSCDGAHARYRSVRMKSSTPAMSPVAAEMPATVTGLRSPANVSGLVASRPASTAALAAASTDNVSRVSRIAVSCFCSVRSMNSIECASMSRSILLHASSSGMRRPLTVGCASTSHRSSAAVVRCGVMSTASTTNTTARASRSAASSLCRRRSWPGTSTMAIPPPPLPPSSRAAPTFSCIEATVPPFAPVPASALNSTVLPAPHGPTIATCLPRPPMTPPTPERDARDSTTSKIVASTTSSATSTPAGGQPAASTASPASHAESMPAPTAGSGAAELPTSTSGCRSSMLRGTSKPIPMMGTHKDSKQSRPGGMNRTQGRYVRAAGSAAAAL
eukprot:365018-Chlamydomonas_euryale.AAC.14